MVFIFLRLHLSGLCLLLTERKNEEKNWKYYTTICSGLFSGISISLHLLNARAMHLQQIQHQTKNDFPWTFPRSFLLLFFLFLLVWLKIASSTFFSYSSFSYFCAQVLWLCGFYTFYFFFYLHPYLMLPLYRVQSFISLLYFYCHLMFDAPSFLCRWLWVASSAFYTPLFYAILFFFSSIFFLSSLLTLLR